MVRHHDPRLEWLSARYAEQPAKSKAEFCLLLDDARTRHDLDREIGVLVHLIPCLVCDRSREVSSLVDRLTEIERTAVSHFFGARMLEAIGMTSAAAELRSRG